MPKVSVILTSLNHGKYLREAIDSVLDQTFSDFELIIWDDASIDDSWDIIQSYKDSRIVTYRNKKRRRGIYGINKAISEVAQGEYIAIHHSDDVWEPEKLEQQVTFLDSHQEFGAVFTNALAIGEEGVPLEDENNFYFKIFNQPNRGCAEWLRHFFFHGNALCHPSVLIRISCYKHCGLYRSGFAQVGDLDMWIRLCLKHEIYIIPQQLVKFRVRDGEVNSSGDRSSTRIRGAYERYRLFQNFRTIERYDFFAKIFPEVNKYCSLDKFDVDYALAMICLETKPSSYALLFAQDILFEALSNQTRASEWLDKFNFDYCSFMAQSAIHDVFSLEQIANLHQEVVQRDLQIANLHQEVVQRDLQIANLHQEVAQRDLQIANLQNHTSGEGVIEGCSSLAGCE